MSPEVSHIVPAHLVEEAVRDYLRRHPTRPPVPRRPPTTLNHYQDDVDDARADLAITRYGWRLDECLIGVGLLTLLTGVAVGAAASVFGFPAFWLTFAAVLAGLVVAATGLIRLDPGTLRERQYEVRVAERALRDYLLDGGDQ